MIAVKLSNAILMIEEAIIEAYQTKNPCRIPDDFSSRQKAFTKLPEIIRDLKAAATESEQGK